MIFEASINHNIGRNSAITRIPLAVFAATFVFLIITMDRFVNQYDEGLILVGATRVLSGDIPYRDFYANYGPAQFYVLAGLFKVFGASVLVERLWDLLVRSCVVLAIYLIVDGGWSRGRAILIAALTGIWLSYFKNYGYPVFPCLLFSLLSLYFVLPVYRGSRAIAPLFTSGICVGITILFRNDVGIAAAGVGAFTLGLFHIARELDAPSRMRALLHSAMIYAGGIAIALVPPLAMLVTAGGAHDMLVDLILVPARTYARMRSLPFPSAVELVRDVIHLEYRKHGWNDRTAVYLPILGALSGVLTATAFFKNRQTTSSIEDQALASQRLWTLVQLTGFSLLFFFKGWVRPSAAHMALAIVPSLAIITVYRAQVRSRTSRMLSAIGMAGVLLASVPPLWSVGVRFAQNLSWVGAGSGVLGLARSDDSGCFPPPNLEPIRCFKISKEGANAIRYIQEHTSGNETIFVGSNRHDKIYINDVLFYFIARRSPVTKWHQFDPGVQTTMEIQSEMVGELQTRRPRYVVLNSEWDSVEEPNESARSSGITVLDEFIRANYRPVREFGPTVILESRW